MNTNMNELNLNEMEMVNGGRSLGEKLIALGEMAGAGAIGGAIAGGLSGSIVPGFGTLIVGGAGAATGGIIGTGIGAIKMFFFDD